MKANSPFPSKTIALYMVRLFLVRTFGILAALVLVLQALDLLGESGKILAAQGNGDAQVWHYVTLRAPQIIARFLPFSVLLGTILTLITMNQNSEVIALKGAGMSAHQVLAPLIVASIGVAALSFAFNDRIVPRATATLNRWQKVDYGPMPVDRGDRTNVWVRSGPDLIEVEQIKADALRERADEVRDRYEHWVDDDPEFAKGEAKRPYLRLLIAADLWGDRGVRCDLAAVAAGRGAA